MRLLCLNEVEVVQGRSASRKIFAPGTTSQRIRRNGGVYHLRCASMIIFFLYDL
jgi:hypothetical protein